MQQQRLAALEVEVEQLQTALRSARRIGAAIGIIMASAKVTEPAAFEVLRVASQNTNRKLRDVADDVVATGLVPARTAPQSLRSQAVPHAG